MKSCPTCNRKFDEEHLSFCTNDGTPLVESSEGSDDPQATLFGVPPPTTNSYPDPAATRAYRPDEMPGGYRQPPGGYREPYGWKEPSSPLPPPPPPQWQPLTPPVQSWTPPPPPQVPFARRGSQQNPLAIASLALGIFSITLGLFCLGFIAAPIAIVLGIVALVQIKSNPMAGGKGMAMAGIATAVGSLLLTFLFLILSIAFN